MLYPKNREIDQRMKTSLVSRNFKAQVAKVALVAHGRVLRLQNPQNATSYAKCPVHLGRFEAVRMCEETEKHVGVYHVCEIPSQRLGAVLATLAGRAPGPPSCYRPQGPAVEAKSGDKQWSNLQLNTHCHTLLTLPWLFFLGEIKTWKKHTHRGWTSPRETSMSHQCLSEMLQCSSKHLKIYAELQLAQDLRSLQFASGDSPAPNLHCQAFTACSLSKVTWTTFPA